MGPSVPLNATPAASASSPTPPAVRPAPSSPPPSRGLACVKHRGALAADARSADGSGLLLPIPPAIFGDARARPTAWPCSSSGATTPAPRSRRRPRPRASGSSSGATPPTDDGELGELALGTRPRILQAVLDGELDRTQADERAAFRLRRRIDATTTGTYVASCSFRTVVYKGLVAADALGRLLPRPGRRALRRPRSPSSTSASPPTPCPRGSGPSPSACCATTARSTPWPATSTACGPGPCSAPRRPASAPRSCSTRSLDPEDSDSGQLDSVVELLTRGGRDIRHAMAMIIPEAWEGERDLDPEVRGFYRYHASLMEPWDGPAGLVFTDGVGVGAALDRNGLRPLRYAVVRGRPRRLLLGGGRRRRVRPRPGHAGAASGPGQMLFVDPTRGVLDDDACKERLAAGGPYARWAADGLRRHVAGAGPSSRRPSPTSSSAARPCSATPRRSWPWCCGPWPTTPRSPPSRWATTRPSPTWPGRPRPLHHYLKQRFAQVTNPPIDHLRERLVMSLRTLLGPRQPHPHRAARRRPGCSCSSRSSSTRRPSSTCWRPTAGLRRAPTSTPPSPWPTGPGGLRAAVERAVRRGRGAGRGPAPASSIIDDGGVGDERAPVPALLATGAVHHRLVAAGLRVEHQPGGLGRRRPRRPLHRLPARLRRRRHLPRPGPGDGRPRGRPQRRRRAVGPRGPGAAAGGHGGRRAQDHVEDGHLHRRLLPGRPDLRGHRPRPGGGRRVLPRHAVDRRRHRLGRAGRGRPRPPRRGPPGRGRLLPGPQAGRVPHPQRRGGEGPQRDEGRPPAAGGHPRRQRRAPTSASPPW